jgi:hypothetical protein
MLYWKRVNGRASFTHPIRSAHIKPEIIGFHAVKEKLFVAWLSFGDDESFLETDFRVINSCIHSQKNLGT